MTPFTRPPSSDTRRRDTILSPAPPLQQLCWNGSQRKVQLVEAAKNGLLTGPSKSNKWHHARRPLQALHNRPPLRPIHSPPQPFKKRPYREQGENIAPLLCQPLSDVVFVQLHQLHTQFQMDVSRSRDWFTYQVSRATDDMNLQISIKRDELAISLEQTTQTVRKDIHKKIMDAVPSTLYGCDKQTVAAYMKVAWDEYEDYGWTIINTAKMELTSELGIFENALVEQLDSRTRYFQEEQARKDANAKLYKDIQATLLCQEFYIQRLQAF